MTHSKIVLVVVVLFMGQQLAWAGPCEFYSLRPQAFADAGVSREVQIGHLILKDSKTKLKMCMQSIGQNVYFTLYTEEDDGIGYIKLQKWVSPSNLHLAKVRIHPEFAGEGTSYVLFDAFFEALRQGILIPGLALQNDITLSAHAVHPFLVKTMKRYGFTKTAYPDKHAITVSMGTRLPHEPTPIFIHGGEPKKTAFMDIVSDQYDAATDYDVVIFEGPLHPGEGIFKIAGEAEQGWENLDVNTGYSLVLNQKTIAQIPRLSGCTIFTPKKERLIQLTTDWRHYKANENEIMALALQLLGINDVSQFRSTRPVKAVIVAAGKGTRWYNEWKDLLEGERGKISEDKNLVAIDGIPSIIRVLDTIASLRNRGVQLEKPIVIVSPGNQKDVEETLASRYDVEIVVQKKAKGTGHAVLQTKENLKGSRGDVIVMWATQPVVTQETLLKSILIHQALGDVAMTVPTTVKHREPREYGRGLYAPLIRGEDGMVIDAWQSHLEKKRVPEFGEDDLGAYVVKTEKLVSALDLAHRLLFDATTGKYTKRHISRPKIGGEYDAPGEFGFPNEMVRTFAQRMEGEVVIGLAMADPREHFGIKEMGDHELAAKFRRELAVTQPLSRKLQDELKMDKILSNVLRGVAFEARN